MDVRQSTKQSEHDAAVSAAKQIYEDKGQYVSRAARRWTTAAEESCTTGTMRKD